MTLYSNIQPLVVANDPRAFPYYYLWQTGEIPPKKMSGLLTMPAFVNPAYGSDSLTRTLVSRYFTMLLCGDPTIVQLTPCQQTFQTQYIPQIWHRDKAQGCFQCHVNVDPLASALEQLYRSQFDRSIRRWHGRRHLT